MRKDERKGSPNQHDNTRESTKIFILVLGEFVLARECQKLGRESPQERN
jgi:hypothetical protein